VSELRKVILGQNVKKLIGISWSSKSNLTASGYRKFELEELAISLDNKETQFLNLQYGDVSSEIELLKANTGIEVLQVHEIDNRNDIDGLATLIMASDHVVSIDNMTVQLAGALGVNTHVLLPYNSDWWWEKNKSKSYWHSSLTLHKQSQPNTCSEALAQLLESLNN
jgi:hypothetical protein